MGAAVLARDLRPPPLPRWGADQRLRAQRYRRQYADDAGPRPARRARTGTIFASTGSTRPSAPTSTGRASSTCRSPESGWRWRRWSEASRRRRRRWRWRRCCRWAAAMAAVAVAARRLIAPWAFALAIAILLCGHSVRSQWSPLRIDHHGWQLALLAVAVASLTDPKRARGGALLGVATALSLVIGLEMLLYLALLGGIVVLMWVRDPAEGRRLATYGASLAGGAALGFLIFASYANRAPVCDALSPVWLSVVAAGGAIAVGLALLGPRSWPLRLGLAGAAGAALAAGFVLAWPHCLGRLEGASPELVRLWLGNVREARPLYMHGYADRHRRRRAAGGGADRLCDHALAAPARRIEARSPGPRRRRRPCSPPSCSSGRAGPDRRRSCSPCRGRRRSPGSSSAGSSPAACCWCGWWARSPLFLLVSGILRPAGLRYFPPEAEAGDEGRQQGQRPLSDLVGAQTGGAGAEGPGTDLRRSRPAADRRHPSRRGRRTLSPQRPRHHRRDARLPRLGGGRPSDDRAAADRLCADLPGPIPNRPSMPARPGRLLHAAGERQGPGLAGAGETAQDSPYRMWRVISAKPLLPGAGRGPAAPAE